MKPELKDPVNVAGAAFAVVGSIMMFSILFEAPEVIAFIGLILWAIGILILAIHSHSKD